MSTADEEDAGIEMVPVPLDRVARRRLVRFAAAIGKQPIHAAAELLTGLLADEQLYDAAAKAAMH